MSELAHGRRWPGGGGCSPEEQSPRGGKISTLNGTKIDLRQMYDKLLRYIKFNSINPIFLKSVISVRGGHVTDRPGNESMNQAQSPVPFKLSAAYLPSVTLS
jgi:hypothetical protein